MSTASIKDILNNAKKAATAYYALTKKPLGITGEIGECTAAELLGLMLAPARMPGYDALNLEGKRIQIKTRRVTSDNTSSNQRLGKLNLDDEWDSVMLVLLDEKYEALSIYEAPRSIILEEIERLSATNPRNYNRGLPVSAFKRISTKIWPTPLSQ